MMTFDQSEEENKAEFVKRLMEAGWTRDEALNEWDRTAEDIEEAGE